MDPIVRNHFPDQCRVFPPRPVASRTLANCAFALVLDAVSGASACSIMPSRPRGLIGLFGSAVPQLHLRQSRLNIRELRLAFPPQKSGLIHRLLKSASARTMSGIAAFASAISTSAYNALSSSPADPSFFLAATAQFHALSRHRLDADSEPYLPTSRRQRDVDYRVVCSTDRLPLSTYPRHHRTVQVYAAPWLSCAGCSNLCVPVALR